MLQPTCITSQSEPCIDLANELNRPQGGDDFGRLAMLSRAEQSGDSACDQERDGGDDHQDLNERKRGARKPFKSQPHSSFRQGKGFQSYEKNG